MGWRGLTTGARSHEKKLYPRKRHFFVMEKYIEDVRQEEKHVPDLLEAIMRPTDPVKEELTARTPVCKNKKHFPSFFAGPGPGPVPWPRPGPLRRRMEKLS